MNETIITGILAILLFVTIVYLIYDKYYKTPDTSSCPSCGTTSTPAVVVCPICGTSTCPSYDLTTICDTEDSRLKESSTLLTGLTRDNILASTELTPVMLSFCDDAYIAKNICPDTFSTYSSMYSDLCPPVTPTPVVLKSSRKYKIVFRDTTTGETKSAIADATTITKIASTADPSATVSVTDATTGTHVSPAEIKKDSKPDREKTVKELKDSMCKVKKTLSPCTCVTGTTTGTKTWDRKYVDKDGKDCPQPSEIANKMTCEGRSAQPVSCACK